MPGLDLPDDRSVSAPACPVLLPPRSPWRGILENLRETLLPGIPSTGAGNKMANLYRKHSPAWLAVQPRLVHALAVASGAVDKGIVVFLSDLAHGAAPSPKPDARAGGGLRSPIYWMLRGRLSPKDLAELLSNTFCFLQPSAFAPADVALLLKRLGEDAAPGAREREQLAMRKLLNLLNDDALKNVLALLGIGLDEPSTTWLKDQLDDTELSQRIDAVNANGKTVPLTLLATDFDHSMICYKGGGLREGFVDAAKRMCPENPKKAVAIIGVTGRIESKGRIESERGGWFALSRLLHALPAPLQVMHGTWSDALAAAGGNHEPLGLRKAAFVLRMRAQALRNPNVDPAALRVFFVGDHMDFKAAKVLADYGVQVRLIYPADHPVPTETLSENLEIVKRWDEAHRPPTTAP